MSFDDKYVINPMTKRPIAINGRIYRRLVRENVISRSGIKDDKILFEIKNTDNMDEKQISETLETAKYILKDKEDLGVEFVKGRGLYKNMIVKKKKPANIEDMANYVSKISAQVLDENEFDRDDIELEDRIKKLIIKKINSNI